MLVGNGKLPTNWGINKAFKLLGIPLGSNEVFKYNKKAILQKDSANFNRILRNVYESDISGCYPRMILVSDDVPVEFKQFM